ncbi:hypothetical protein TNIN_250541 [Trichonephila inaurata madagascariensis]|uniref:Uncharacterized protein n=1 Tax=Trichonephila inaurata madagascariensis TaxID=2747483 RepID=A0A8X6XJV0_9ARAC|nr:hypothetical protein TNIN_250541 [Trichonephila inaurata madagascariensis]
MQIALLQTVKNLKVVPMKNNKCLLSTAESGTQAIQNEIVDTKVEPQTPPAIATALQCPNLCASPIKNISAIQIDTSSFTEFVNKYSFIDETKLVKDFIE